MRFHHSWFLYRRIRAAQRKIIYVFSEFQHFLINSDSEPRNLINAKAVAAPTPSPDGSVVTVQVASVDTSGDGTNGLLVESPWAPLPHLNSKMSEAITLMSLRLQY